MQWSPSERPGGLQGPAGLLVPPYPQVPAGVFYMVGYPAALPQVAEGFCYQPSPGWERYAESGPSPWLAAIPEGFRPWVAYEGRELPVGEGSPPQGEAQRDGAVTGDQVVTTPATATPPAAGQPGAVGMVPQSPPPPALVAQASTSRHPPVEQDDAPLFTDEELEALDRLVLEDRRQLEVAAETHLWTDVVRKSKKTTAKAAGGPKGRSK